jgi:hypothetical protein
MRRCLRVVKEVTLKVNWAGFQHMVTLSFKQVINERRASRRQCTAVLDENRECYSYYRSHEIFI